MPIFKFSFLSIFQSFSYELLYTTSQHMVLFYTLYERSEARPLLVCYFGKVEPIYNASNLCTSTTSSSRLICIEPFWSATQAFQRDWLKHSKQSFSQSYWEMLLLVQWTQNYRKFPPSYVSPSLKKACVFVTSKRLFWLVAILLTEVTPQCVNLKMVLQLNFYNTRIWS